VITLKRAATWIASTIAVFDTPAARTASASSGVSSSGRSVSFLDEAEHRAQPVVDRRGAPVALDRLPDLVPSAYDATAPWAFVQKWHSLRYET
jgi:hypothetical protein